jgi:hypothetical protein
VDPSARHADSPGPLRRGVAWTLAIAATLRVVVHGLVDARPRFGGAEANDLVDLVRHHQALRGTLEAGLSTGLLGDPYKPPLYYGGLPLLLGWRPTLDYVGVLAVNAVALLLACVAAWRLARRLGGPRAGPWAVLAVVALPAVAGRVTVAGVEPLQMTLLLWTLVGLLELWDWPRPSVAIATGAVVAAGLLVKWTFAGLLAAPLVLAAAFAWRGSQRGRRLGLLALALAVGAAPFALWLSTAGEPAAIAAGAGMDATTSEVLGRSALLYLPRWAAVEGVGPWAIPLVLAGALGLALHRPAEATPGRWLLAAAALGALVVHVAIPHKEARYLLPGFGPLAVLLALGLAGLEARGRAWTGALLAAGALLLAGTFVVPLLSGDRPLEARLHLVTQTDDRGLSELIGHDAFAGEGPLVVAASLDGERPVQLAQMLAWELYSGSERPLLLLPPDRDLRWEHARARLARADAFVVNRPPSPEDRRVLADGGFVLADVVSLRLPDAERLEIWRRR